MPLGVQPPLIEQTDWTGGFTPDGEDAATDLTGLLDVLNLVYDEPSGSLVTRPGLFLDLTYAAAPLDDHYVRNVYPFQAPGGSYLVLVLTDGSANADNVGLLLYDVEAGTAVRMDTAGRTWANPTAHHWGIAIDGVWFGGVIGEPMYSYNTLTDTWNDDAGVNPNWKTVVDDVNDNIDTDTQWARDYAWKGTERGLYSGDLYRPSRSIRFDEYDEDEKRYLVGDKVSRKTIWDTTETYWKSFKCILKHDPSADPATTAPGTGTDWRTYWTKVRLPLPVGGGETNNGWYFVPTASETSVACWYADRLFLRYDDEGDRSRLQFSAPLKPNKGQDIPDVVFDPTDFAPGNDKLGAGGGWVPINDGTHHGFINALLPLSDRLMVFKRQAVWALVGTDPDTWYAKHIVSGVGCVGPKAVEHIGGLVYFLTDEGLWVSDGQEAQEAPGNEKLATYMRTRMDISLPDRPDQLPSMAWFEGFLWISIPSDDDEELPGLTLAYHPGTGSFWKTDLPILDMARHRELGVTRLAVAAIPAYGDIGTNDPRVFLLKSDATVDDDGVLGNPANAQDIPWSARTTWWSFSVHRAERRIRKTWALVKGVVADTVTIVSKRNYDNTTITTTNRTVAAATPTHYEGQWFRDSHAVNFTVSGTQAPAALYGIAVDSQPRRPRYHTG